MFRKILKQNSKNLLILKIEFIFFQRICDFLILDASVQVIKTGASDFLFKISISWDRLIIDKVSREAVT